ncbi:hypothetical protein POX_a00524 [Penicillium oxalicum]|uniref:hypothetical protein n=1 Tax=Penicillium oxalicum TaxID=69781 RepID=UPI0020B89FB2|nr:hypothetical protein POX_a00524 [Penicillium oxalicum]KAI2793936.1 hypothetical protein POX_a00524 [Penicillium oxalicum]
MAPQMLHRVIHGTTTPQPWQKNLIRFQPARLYGYRRHRVQGAEYPGIFAESSPSETAVLGVLVSGLTEGDMYRLDRYEGSEYVKESVKVRTLHSKAHGKVTSEDELFKELNAAESGAAREGDEVLATTYVWVAGKECLEEAEWDFERFKRDRLAWWVGAHESEW